MPEDRSSPEARAAVRAFLAACPPLTPAPSDLPDLQRAHCLQDAAWALAHLSTPHSTHNEAQRAAVQVFDLAAAIWAAFLEDASGPPSLMAARIHRWAVEQLLQASVTLPPPLIGMLSDIFPRIGPWLAVVTLTQAMTADQAGEAAAWGVVAHLAQSCTAQGFEDGEGEDLGTVILEALNGQQGRALN